MFSPQWLQELQRRWFPRSGKRRRRTGRVSASTRHRFRPCLEVLEDRLTPSGDVLVIGTTSSPTPASTTNQPSGAVIVQLQDGSGNAVAAANDLTVNLSSSSTTGQFLDLSGKALASSSVTIPTGSSFALFEYEDSQAGDPTIKAETSDSSALGQTTFNVNNVLAFTTPIQVLAPNQMSGTMTVQLQDGKGNAITAASDTTINLFSSSNTTGEFLDISGNPLPTDGPGYSNLTITAGSNSASFEYEDSQKQSFPSTIFASLSGQLSSSSAFGSQEVYVGIPLVITTPPQTLTPGQASDPITIQLETAAPSDLTINLTSSSLQGQFLDTSGNVLPNSNGTYSLTIPAGASSASFKYKDSQTGSAFLSAVNANDPTQFANVVEGVGVPAQSSPIIISPWQALALNQTSPLLTVQLQNNGTPITTPSDLTLHLSSSSSTGQFLDSSGNPLTDANITIPAGSTSVSFEYEDSQAGLPQLSASLSGAGSFSNLPQVEDVGDVALAFSTAAQTFSAGQQSQPITVQLQDSNGNAVMASGDVPVNLSSGGVPGAQFFDTSGNPLSFSFPSITIAAGKDSASFKYESSIWGGKQTLTTSPSQQMFVASSELSSFNAPPISATQEETIQGPSTVVLTETPPVTAGQMSGLVTVQLEDNDGNVVTAPSGGATIVLSAPFSTMFFDANGDPLPTTFGGATLTIAGGSSTASFKFQTPVAGVDTITASVPGVFSAHLIETILPGSAAPTITGNPSNRSATAGANVSFTASASGSTPLAVQWQVSTDGGKTFTYINGAISTTFTLNNVTTAMSGNQYRAVFSNSAGTATTSAATLTVNASPPPAPSAPPAPPVLQTPPLLGFLNSLFGGGTVTVNANGTETVTDSFFGIPLIVSTFDPSGNLVSVKWFGFDITFLFLLL